MNQRNSLKVITLIYLILKNILTNQYHRVLWGRILFKGKGENKKMNNTNVSKNTLLILNNYQQEKVWIVKLRWFRKIKILADSFEITPSESLLITIDSLNSRKIRILSSSSPALRNLLRYARAREKPCVLNRVIGPLLRR